MSVEEGDLDICEMTLLQMDVWPELTMAVESAVIANLMFRQTLIMTGPGRDLHVFLNTATLTQGRRRRFKPWKRDVAHTTHETPKNSEKPIPQILVYPCIQSASLHGHRWCTSTTGRYSWTKVPSEQ